MSGEKPAHRLKRMKMQAWRRGIREMDLILGPYADAHLDGFDATQLDRFDVLLQENDQDLMAWITGQQTPPAALKTVINQLSDHAKTL